VTRSGVTALVALAMLATSCVDHMTQLVAGSGGKMVELMRSPSGGFPSSLLLPGIDAEHVYFDLEGGTIVAVNRRSGAESWRVERTASSPSALVVHDGRVLYASSHAVALDATNGTELWSVPLDDDAGLGVPAAAGGVLFAGTGKWLYALDVVDGAERWRREIGAGFAFAGIVRGVAVGGDTVYVTMEEFLDLNGAAARAHLVAVSAATGEELWRFVDSDFYAKRGARFEPSVAADVVIIGDTWGHEYVAVDRATGLVRYRLPNEDPYWAGPFEAPTIRNDTAFGGSGDGRVTAWDAADGTIHWRTDAGGTISSIVPCGPFVLAQDLNSTILDRRTGEYLARSFHRRPGENVLLVTRWQHAGNEVYVGGLGYFYGYRCTD
jgi:outer membrane protein assembly factor BamB